ncbi:MAG: hypothetical protein HWN51_06450 [Desulfobacterales bacterium]|nr:hypothetical protein [Desulfobacterales bacterium]
MISPLLEEWLVAVGSTSGSRYVVHTHQPVFFLEMRGCPDCGYVPAEFEYVDECLDAEQLASLARQATEVLARYDEESG